MSHIAPCDQPAVSRAGRGQRTIMMEEDKFSLTDLENTEIEIKLDITKKSKKLNRPVHFSDQKASESQLCTLVPCDSWCRAMCWRP